MMNFISRSRSRLKYDSIAWHDSQVLPGARFAIKKVSLAGRMELIGKIRDLYLKHDFLRAGDRAEQSEAALADLLVQKLYLEWALDSIGGLDIDGAAARVDSLIANGPEELSDEIISHIRSELGLTEEERKNS